MSAIPYKVASEISSVFLFPAQFYYAAWDVLVGMDGLGLGLHFWFQTERASRSKKPSPEDLPLPNQQAAYCVLRHVVFRTLHFNKVVEFIRVNDIIEGMPTIGIAGAPFKERVIKHALKYLSQAEALLKIRLPASKAATPMYGVNLPIFLAYLDMEWKAAIELTAYGYDDEYDEVGQAKSVKSLRAQKLLGLLVSYLENYKPVFKHIEEQKSPITAVADFRDQLASIRPDGNTCSYAEYELTEGIRNSRVRIRDLKPKKWKDIEECGGK